MLYWNIERELVEGEPLFLSQTKQLHNLNFAKSTRDKIYSQISGKAELAKINSAKYQSRNI